MKVDGPVLGTVVENDDQEGRCQIKAEIPLLEGDTGWCRPVLPSAGDGCGLAIVPEIGASVLILWEHDDLGSQPFWLGTSFTADPIAGAGPGVAVIRTAGGHELRLSDTDTALTISCSQGPVITLDDRGVTVSTGQGAQLVLKGATVSINNGALEVQ